MITGDGDFTVITADNVELWEGLGLFSGVIVDQHFSERHRLGRLISAVAYNPRLLGLGVDENTQKLRLESGEADGVFEQFALTPP